MRQETITERRNEPVLREWAAVISQDLFLSTSRILYSYGIAARKVAMKLIGHEGKMEANSVLKISSRATRYPRTTCCRLMHQILILLK